MRLAALPRCGAFLMLAGLLGGCEPSTATPSTSLSGDPQAGRAAIERVGCCVRHRIPGVSGARGIVGPSLEGFRQRAYIAGIFPNRLDRLAHWVRSAPELAPNTAMPAMPINEKEARDIAAYLHTLP